MLAIIIPYYKLTFFRETLDSLAAQTDQRFHVYIGNDASPEDPESLLKEFEGKFAFTYKKFNDNLGGTSLTRQWERCIEMMQNEEWFMILGDDDVLTDQVVASFYHKVHHIISIGAQVIRFDYQQIDGFGKFTSKLYKTNQLLDPVYNLIEKLKNNLFTSLSQYIFKKEAYIRYGFKDLPMAWGSDDLAVFEIAEQNPIFNINEKVLVRISDINISGNKELKNVKNEALITFFSLLLKKTSFNQKDFDFVSDLYFNQVLVRNKFSEIMAFLRSAFFRASKPKIIYFTKAIILRNLNKG